MHPYLKFYAAKNPAFGKEIEPVVAPTFEEWEELLGYEPDSVAQTEQRSDFVRWVK